MISVMRNSTLRTRPRREIRRQPSREVSDRRAWRVARIHFQPRVRRHSFEDRHLPGLRAGMPVLYRPPGIEHERKLADLVAREMASTRCRRAWPCRPLLEIARRRRAGSCLTSGRSCRERPLDSAMLFDQVVAHVRSSRKAGPSETLLPFLERVARDLSIQGTTLRSIRACPPAREKYRNPASRHRAG